MIKHSALLVITTVFIFLCGCQNQPKKPNIVLLFVDDLGWADMGYRNSIYQTPNIDRLKDEGIDFTRFYIPTPTCSPSRVSVLTGKEAARLGMVRHITHEDNVTGRNESEYNYWEKDPANNPSRNWLPLNEKTYAEALNEHGYYNMFIGKWHCGHEEFHPVQQGFDAQYGTGNHGHPNSYYAPFFKHANPLSEFTNREYLTDVLTDKAQEFIANYDRNQPFMLSMWYYAVHGPFVGRTDWLAYYKKTGLDEKQAKYAAMVTVMDESVGNIRKALINKGIDENTVIIFTSDQGGAFKNGNFRGGKFGGETLCEGGARVPLIIYYPGVTKPKMLCDVPVQSIDIYPTLVEIASGKACNQSEINGVSLMPLLKNESINNRNLYFYRSYEDQYAAVINGHWKLIKYRSGKYELYNLNNDEGEQHNLIKEELVVAQQLKQDLNDWETEAVNLQH